MQKILQKVPSSWLIFFATILAYLPYLNTRVARMTGDEKVYISQAVEMYERGAYWTQTLHGNPEYFKGPLHLWAIKLGLFIFGNQLIAGLWMHLVLLLFACLLFHRSIKSLVGESTANWITMTSILSLGVYSHAYASQMEAELVSFSLIWIAILLSPSSKSDFLFWILCGIGGWIKSPLYSLLWGIGGILFWSLDGTIQQRLKNPRSWFAVFLGVSVCCLGYLPSYLLDGKNFVDDFIYREQFRKSSNGEPWYYVWKSLIHFSVPFLFWTTSGLILFISNYKKVLTKIENKKIFHAALSLFLPPAFFFSMCSYKGQNYLLPYITSFFVLAGLGWSFEDQEKIRKKSLLKFCFIPNSIVLMTLAILISIVVYHFYGTSEFSWMMCGFLPTLVFLTLSSFYFLSPTFPKILLATISFFLSFSSFAYFIGDRELWSIRELQKDNPNSKIIYAVSGDNIFNEWALMRLALHESQIEVVSGQEAIKNRILSQDQQPTLWVAQTPDDDIFLKAFTDSYSGFHTERIPWKKWLTKAGGKDRERSAKLAWQEKTLEPFQRSMWIYRIQKLQ